MIGSLFSVVKAGLNSFTKDESGSATLDFAIALPAYMLIFSSTYESGMHSTRQVMLQHGLDQTAREVRIGRIPSPDHDILTEKICEYSSIIPDCLNQIRLEMVVRDPRAWTPPVGEVQCVDRESDGDPVLNFTNGANNQLMVLRACALFDPMIPGSGLGYQLPKKSGGAYAIVASSAYVMEPFQ